MLHAQLLARLDSIKKEIADLESMLLEETVLFKKGSDQDNMPESICELCNLEWTDRLETYLRRLGFLSTTEWSKKCREESGSARRSGRTTQILLRALYCVEKGAKKIIFVAGNRSRTLDMIMKLQGLASGTGVSLGNCVIRECTTEQLRSLHGLGEDVFVFKDHPYTEKLLKSVILNGRYVDVSETMSYKDIAILARLNPERNPTITYARGGSQSSGLLSNGDIVSTIDGMVFNATYTDNA
jgi:hypothetical protein